MKYQDTLIEQSSELYVYIQVVFSNSLLKTCASFISSQSELSCYSSLTLISSLLSNTSLLFLFSEIAGVNLYALRFLQHNVFIPIANYIAGINQRFHKFAMDVLAFYKCKQFTLFVV